MKMDDFIQRMLQTGVGLASAAAERLEDTVKDLIKDGKLSTDEGKRIVSDFMNDTKEQRSFMNSKVASVREQVKEKLDLPTSKEVKKLKKRIKKLEKAIARLEKAQGE